jgi:predicted amidohydrolase
LGQFGARQGILAAKDWLPRFYVSGSPVVVFRTEWRKRPGMRVVLIQFPIENLQPEKNRARVSALVLSAPAPDPTLLVLPELFSTGVLPEGFAIREAEALAREDRSFLSELARKKSAYVLGSTLGAENGILLNVAMLWDPNGKKFGEYRKIHPFSLGGEEKIFRPGDATLIWEVGGFHLQPSICYDLRFPELFRAGMKQGATLMTVQANWPEARQAHWEILLKARAIENQCYVAGVNCLGTQNGLRYAGGSIIVSPKGEALASAGSEEGLAVGELFPQTVDSWRKVFPALRDRKPEGFWG